MNNVPSWILILLLVCLPTGVAAGDADDQQQSEFFEKRVRPLLAKHCYDCHSAEEGEYNGELVLETLSGIRAGGSRGDLFHPGKPDESLFFQAIAYKNPDLLMPPEGKMTDSEVEVFRLWIASGAKIPDYKEESKAMRSGVDFEQGRQFWSFAPLADGAPPAGLKNSGWVRMPIDAFVLKRLEDEGLTPSRQADRRTLIRRLSFDLIGLPPSYEEVEAFVADPAPDAYEQLVERLLASPQYGERWGRFWLDLARYTDTTASWLKSTANAWLYRDWVVQAFNENRPFDEFVRLQLAADLDDATDPADLAALGFLGLSPTYWKELKLAPELIEQIVAEEWDEQVDAVSRTFLGLTVACARCHDHKFDPISTADYYGLAGVFASTQLTDRPLLPEPAASVVIEAKAKVDELQGKLEKIKDKKSDEAAAIQDEIARIKSETPNYDVRWANAVKDSAVYVLPDGDDMTKLDYRDGHTRDLPVFRRGNPSNPGEVVPRRFLTVLSESEPVVFEKGSGRGDLAEALLATAQPLTARVWVNRVWAQHFGAGLVRTPSDFGSQGERPTHPELLDYLASRFIASGWDVKELHREMVLSSTYRQSSAYDEGKSRLDADNRLLWRMNRRRLDVEMWRDAMLAAAGSLDLTLGGPSTDLQDVSNRRRTMYGKIDRHDLDRLLRLYDFPEPTSHSPGRLPTTTPLQQLLTLNSPMLQQQASLLSERTGLIENEPDRIIALYRRVFSRDPSDDELKAGRTFVDDPGAGPDEVSRWRNYVHALLALNEFMFVD